MAGLAERLGMGNNAGNAWYLPHQCILDAVNNVMNGLHCRLGRKAAMVVDEKAFLCRPHPNVVQVTDTFFTGRQFAELLHNRPLQTRTWLSSMQERGRARLDMTFDFDICSKPFADCCFEMGR